jgi:predicted DNA-binding protein YlxM (UPF0122 family)
MTKQITKQETKNGGPYTKPEQEKRRSKVYELYFEQGYSARKIAKELGANRNTVDSDIRVLLSQGISHMGKDKVAGLLLEEIQRFEMQRKRILDFLDPKDFKKSMTAEKILLALEDKLASFVSKLAKSSTFEKFGATEEITQEEIVDLVRGIVFSKGYPCCETKESILEEIISDQKCNTEHAENVFEKMISLGLGFTAFASYPLSYDLVRFSVMRGYISQEELAELKQAYQEKI